MATFYLWKYLRKAEVTRVAPSADSIKRYPGIPRHWRPHILVLGCLCSVQANISLYKTAALFPMGAINQPHGELLYTSLSHDLLICLCTAISQSDHNLLPSAASSGRITISMFTYRCHLRVVNYVLYTTRETRTHHDAVWMDPIFSLYFQERRLAGRANNLFQVIFARIWIVALRLMASMTLK